MGRSLRMLRPDWPRVTPFGELLSDTSRKIFDGNYAGSWAKLVSTLGIRPRRSYSARRSRRLIGTPSSNKLNQYQSEDGDPRRRRAQMATLGCYYSSSLSAIHQAIDRSRARLNSFAG